MNAYTAVTNKYHNAEPRTGLVDHNKPTFEVQRDDYNRSFAITNILLKTAMSNVDADVILKYMKPLILTELMASLSIKKSIKFNLEIEARIQRVTIHRDGRKL